MATRNAQDSFFKHSAAAIQTHISGKPGSMVQNDTWRGSFSLENKRTPIRHYFQAAYVDLYDMSFIFSQMQASGRHGQNGRPPVLLPAAVR
jgi:hypothetical protein